MKFEQASKLEDEEFRRLTGVKRSTFKRMIEDTLAKHQDFALPV